MKNKYRNTSRRKTPWDNSQDISPLEEFIKSKYLDSFRTKHPKLKDTSEAELFISYVLSTCKHCSSLNIIKRGLTSNGVQRYHCLDCKKSFTILTSTEWIEFCLDIFRYESISVTAKSNKNSYNTSKYWLHKLFLILDDIQDSVLLQGCLQIDETFIPVQEQDKILKDGKQLRGLSRNQCCIGIGYDGNFVYAHFEGYGKTSQIKTKEAFISHIEIGSHLVHDKEKSHIILLKELNLSDEAYDAKDLKNLADKDNPLDPINNQCDLLKQFLYSHGSFNREYIQGYLNLFCFMQNPPHNKLEKVKILLARALYNPKSLKYRDLYAKKQPVYRVSKD